MTSPVWEKKRMVSSARFFDFEIKQEGRVEGRSLGRFMGERSLILRQLTRAVGELPQDVGEEYGDKCD